VTDTTTAPTALEIERYIQLDALWLIATGGRLGDRFNDLLPDLCVDDIDLVERTGGESTSHAELFERIVPSGDEDSPRVKLIGARVELLAARLLRSIDPKQLEREARQFDLLAAASLAAVAGDA
jgi:hypothetical protein